MVESRLFAFLVVQAIAVVANRELKVKTEHPRNGQKRIDVHGRLFCIPLHSIILMKNQCNMQNTRKSNINSLKILVIHTNEEIILNFAADISFEMCTVQLFFAIFVFSASKWREAQNAINSLIDESICMFAF